MKKGLWDTRKQVVGDWKKTCERGGGGGEENWVAHNKGRGDHKVKQKRLIGSYISSLPENQNQLSSLVFSCLVLSCLVISFLLFSFFSTLLFFSVLFSSLLSSSLYPHLVSLLLFSSLLSSSLSPHLVSPLLFSSHLFSSRLVFTSLLFSRGDRRNWTAYNVCCTTQWGPHLFLFSFFLLLYFVVVESVCMPSLCTICLFVIVITHCPYIVFVVVRRS